MPVKAHHSLRIFLVHIILLKQNRVITSIVQPTIKPMTSIYDIRFFNIFV